VTDSYAACLVDYFVAQANAMRICNFALPDGYAECWQNQACPNYLRPVFDRCFSPDLCMMYNESCPSDPYPCD
jgi:hypothetical protein